ncbi:MULTISPECIES: hypothetical protein [Pseudanabaena]|uniref:Nucleotide-diphospho-sugar transferase domain-containing protein n=2 Tax=Pseudanabaena TaxID=1152 RepID=L8MTU0_9CYAN|nr:MULTISPECIES: hypothetical protein [Pseudanabaena]ELS30846.1 hypothetical protein Pse7429DRAFT_4070 [Pseudanabaena biceps PCC 7429]MDG3496885.1 hypothetical protein [Pseudanabaena catenata USMAC16]
MVNIGYHAAKIQGNFLRSIYKSSLSTLVSLPIAQKRQVPIKVYALSCERDLPEQVASLRSFLRYVGIPELFTVMSDGSYTEESIKLLRRIHPCVDVQLLTKFQREDLPQSVYEYASQQAMGKKLAALMSIPIDGATLYTDSDILFFQGASNLAELATSESSATYYLPDCKNSLDKRLIYEDIEQQEPINAGFILFKKALDWHEPVQRLAKLQELPNYFSEQTIVNLTIKSNRGQALDRDKYVMNVDDQFVYPDRFVTKQTAMRHYVSDIRHKFWQSVFFHL